MTNRQIGQSLYLSHRTVSSHLYRIFPKLDVSSRAQLGVAWGCGQAARSSPTAERRRRRRSSSTEAAARQQQHDDHGDQRLDDPEAEARAVLLAERAHRRVGRGRESWPLFSWVGSEASSFASAAVAALPSHGSE